MPVQFLGVFTHLFKAMPKPTLTSQASPKKLQAQSVLPEAWRDHAALKPKITAK
jgi:hypothetical protein